MKIGFNKMNILFFDWKMIVNSSRPKNRNRKKKFLECFRYFSDKAKSFQIKFYGNILSTRYYLENASRKPYVVYYVLVLN